MIANNEIMAKNIKRYMEAERKTADEICKYLDIPTSTFSYWVNAKAYPRIDKIEMLANFFGCKKSDLVEEFINDNEKEKALEQLSQEQKGLLEVTNKMSADDIKLMIEFAKRLKNGN